MLGAMQTVSAPLAMLSRWENLAAGLKPSPTKQGLAGTIPCFATTQDDLLNHH